MATTALLCTAAHAIAPWSVRHPPCTDSGAGTAAASDASTTSAPPRDPYTEGEASSAVIDAEGARGEPGLLVACLLISLA